VHRRVRHATTRRFVVEQNDTRLAEYTVEYTFVLLPGVNDEDFEPGKSLLEDAGFGLTQAHFGAFGLQHRFSKRIRSKDNPDQYVWQIRILETSSMTVTATDDAIYESLHQEVSRTLAPAGIPVSRTILEEIAVAPSR
jgi:hypothetical protein